MDISQTFLLRSYNHYLKKANGKCFWKLGMVNKRKTTIKFPHPFDGLLKMPRIEQINTLTEGITQNHFYLKFDSTYIQKEFNIIYEIEKGDGVGEIQYTFSLMRDNQILFKKSFLRSKIWKLCSVKLGCFDFETLTANHFEKETQDLNVVDYLNLLPIKVQSMTSNLVEVSLAWGKGYLCKSGEISKTICGVVCDDLANLFGCANEDDLEGFSGLLTFLKILTKNLMSWSQEAKTFKRKNRPPYIQQIWLLEVKVQVLTLHYLFRGFSSAPQEWLDKKSLDSFCGEVLDLIGYPRDIETASLDEIIECFDRLGSHLFSQQMDQIIVTITKEVVKSPQEFGLSSHFVKFMNNLKTGVILKPPEVATVASSSRKELVFVKGLSKGLIDEVFHQLFLNPNSVYFGSEHGCLLKPGTPELARYLERQNLPYELFNKVKTAKSLASTLKVDPTVTTFELLHIKPDPQKDQIRQIILAKLYKPCRGSAPAYEGARLVERTLLGSNEGAKSDTSRVISEVPWNYKLLTTVSNQYVVGYFYMITDCKFSIMKYNTKAQSLQFTQYDVDQFNKTVENSKLEFRTHFSRLESIEGGFCFNLKINCFLTLGFFTKKSRDLFVDDQSFGVLFGYNLNSGTAVCRLLKNPPSRLGIQRCFERKGNLLHVWIDASKEVVLTTFRNDKLMVVSSRKIAPSSTGIHSWVWNHVHQRPDWWSVKRNETDNSYELRLKTFDIRV